MTVVAGAGSGRGGSLGRSAVTLVLASLLGPAASLGLEVALGWRYGTSYAVDLYRSVSGLLAIVQSLVAAQIMPHLVIPLVAKRSAEGEAGKGYGEACGVAVLVMALVAPVAMVGLGAPSALLDVIAPGLVERADSGSIWMVRAAVLAVLAICLGGVAGGLLQYHGKFMQGPLAQAAGTGVMALVVLLGHDSDRPLVLGFGLIAGAGTALAANLWVAAGLVRADVAGLQARELAAAARRGVRHVGEIGKLAILALGPAATGFVAVRELTLFAEGSVAEFGYAWKLLLLASLLPASIATVVFPAVSKTRQSGDEQASGAASAWGWWAVVATSLPLSWHFWVWRQEVVVAMFGRGAMSEAGLANTAAMLGILLFAVPANGVTVLMTKLAIAEGDVWPALGANMATAAASWILLPMVGRQYGPQGIACGVTGLYIAQAVLLGLTAREVRASGGCRGVNGHLDAAKLAVPAVWAIGTFGLHAVLGGAVKGRGPLAAVLAVGAASLVLVMVCWWVGRLGGGASLSRRPAPLNRSESEC